MSRVFKLTGTESSSAKCASLRLLGSTKGSRCLWLRLTKGSSSGTESASTCGCGAFEVSMVRTSLKRDTRTESAGGGLLTESRITRAEEAAGLLLRLLLLCGTEAASTEASRWLWLSLTKRTKRGPGLLLLLWLWLLLLLAKCTKPRSSSGAGRSKSASATAKSRLCGLCCGLGLAEQAPTCPRLCCRTKRAGTKSSCGGCFTILLVVL